MYCCALDVSTDIKFGINIAYIFCVFHKYCVYSFTCLPVNDANVMKVQVGNNANGFY